MHLRFLRGEEKKSDKIDEWVANGELIKNCNKERHSLIEIEEKNGQTRFIGICWIIETESKKQTHTAISLHKR